MRDPCLGMPWGPPTIPGHGVSGQPCMLCCTQMFHNFTTLIPESQLIFNQENSALTQGEVTREFLGIWKKNMQLLCQGIIQSYLVTICCNLMAAQETFFFRKWHCQMKPRNYDQIVEADDSFGDSYFLFFQFFFLIFQQFPGLNHSA